MFSSQGLQQYASNCNIKSLRNLEKKKSDTCLFQITLYSLTPAVYHHFHSFLHYPIISFFFFFSPFFLFFPLFWSQEFKLPVCSVHHFLHSISTPDHIQEFTENSFPSHFSVSSTKDFLPLFCHFHKTHLVLSPYAHAVNSFHFSLRI